MSVCRYCEKPATMYDWNNPVVPICRACGDAIEAKRPRAIANAVGAWSYLRASDATPELLAAGWELCGVLLKYTHHEETR